MPLLRRRRARSAGEPLDDVESRVVWLLGGPRTGSTWLLELLAYPLRPATDNRSGAARRPEAGREEPQVLPINEPYIGVHLLPVLAAEPDAVVTAADSRAGDPSYFFDERYADVWRPRLRELVLERFRAQEEAAAKEHGLRRPALVVKEPNGSQAAGLLTDVLPRSRLLVLHRDGRDVLDSLLDAAAPGGWMSALTGGIETPDERLKFLRTNAASWVHRVRTVQAAVESQAPGLTKTVRYEDLRADTRPGLEDILDWLGLQVEPAAAEAAVAALSFERYPAEAKGRGKALRFARTGRWRENMSSKEQELMAEVMGPELESLGYD